MNAVSIIPVGTVTFLFTDLEGSTRSWEQQGRAMSTALARHDAIVRQSCAGNNGYVFKTLGDAFCVAFGAAHDALAAAIDLQFGLLAEDWQAIGMATPLSLRLALHTGPVETRDGDYFGPTLNRTSRLLATAHGGQSLLSEATAVMVREHLLGNMALKGLGEHRLKDLQRAESVYQLVCPPLPTDFPPLRSLEGRPHNLPLQLTMFVGRETALADAAMRLRDPGTRLLTLLGPGGTGKTRIALQLGAEALDDFEDGVFFVPLETHREASEVVGSLAHALGVQGGDLSAVRNYLREKHLLLVLDNFEQLVDAGPLVVDLLRGAPGLKVVVTSRIRLQVSGEHVVQVFPLDVPDPASLPSLDQLTQYESVRLFIDRGQAANAGFRIDEENAPAVAEICHRLDGLPLAIELAAARLGMFPPGALLGRLGRGLSATLTGGSRDLTARQRTLRGAIGWSHDLLGAGEQALLARLSVCAGGFTIEAAEAVAGDVVEDVVEGLEVLVNGSLVTQRVDTEGEPRFGLLATIRDFAAEQLGGRGEADAVRGSHLGYYLALAKRCEPLVVGREQVRWISVMRAELENIRGALEWGLGEARDGEGAEARAERVTWASELCHACREVFGEHGRRNELSHWAKRSMGWIDPANVEGAVPGLEPLVVVDPRLLARIRCGYASVDTTVDTTVDTSLRRRLLEEVRDTCDALGDHVGAGLASEGRWIIPTRSAGFNEQDRHENLVTALSRYRLARYRRGVAEMLALMAYSSVKLGHAPIASSELDEALAVAREAFDPKTEMLCLYVTAFASRRSGDFHASAQAFEQFEALNRIRPVSRLGPVGGMPLWIGLNHSWVRIAIGDRANAERVIGELEHNGRRQGADRWLSGAWLRQGDLARVKGDYSVARSHYGKVPHQWAFNPPLRQAQVEAMVGNVLATVHLLIKAVERYRVRAAEHWADDADVAGEVAACIAEADPVTALRVGAFASAMRTSGRADLAYPFDQARIDDRLATARSLVSTEVADASWQAGSCLGAEEAYAEAEASLRVMADRMGVVPATGR